MKRAWIVAVVSAMALSSATFYWLGARRAGSGAAPPVAADRRVLYWYDPMSPQQHFDHPGKSPLMPSMDLVPKFAGAHDEGEPGGVHIDPAVVQNLGVRTAPVRVAALAHDVRVPASVGWNLRAAVTISARVDETIERLDVRAPFDAVRKGQPIARVLAPQWSAPLAEYHALLTATSESARGLQTAARARLRTLGLNDTEIAAANGGSGIVLRAPLDGVVAQLAVQQGQQVVAGAPLMVLNSLDTVWVEADVPQAQMPGITAGTQVKITTSVWPGESFAASVQAVLPQIDMATRTQRVRIELSNPDHRLVPGMFAQVRIEAPAGMTRPLVPDEALIATGDDTRVVLAEGDGRFRVVRVHAGLSAGGETEILRGLFGGERVVTSGQFLIDSEASLSGALQRLPADAESPAQRTHPDGAHAEPRQ